MKTDVVLTMGERLDECRAFWKPVSAPALDARHVPIAAGGDIDLKRETHGCRCDRWGHPWPRCLEPEAQTRTASHDFCISKQVR